MVRKIIYVLLVPALLHFSNTFAAAIRIQSSDSSIMHANYDGDKINFILQQPSYCRFVINRVTDNVPNIISTSRECIIKKELWPNCRYTDNNKMECDGSIAFTIWPTINKSHTDEQSLLILTLQTCCNDHCVNSKILVTIASNKVLQLTNHVMNRDSDIDIMQQIGYDDTSAKSSVSTIIKSDNLHYEVKRYNGIHTLAYIFIIYGIIITLIPRRLPLLKIQSIFTQYNASLLRRCSIGIGIGSFAFSLALGVIIHLIKFAVTAISHAHIIDLWGAPFSNLYLTLCAALMSWIFLLLLSGKLNLSNNLLSPYFIEPQKHRHGIRFGALYGFLLSPRVTPYAILAIIELFAAPSNAILISIFMGLGVSAPYFIISFFPQSISTIAKDDNGLSKKSNINVVIALYIILRLGYIVHGYVGISVMIFLSIMFIISGMIMNAIHDSRMRWLMVFLSFAISLGSISLVRKNPTPMVSNKYWTAMSQEQIKRDLDRGRIVLVNFAPRWCISCNISNLIMLRKKNISLLSEVYGLILVRNVDQDSFYQDTGSYPKTALTLYSKANPEGRSLPNFTSDINLKSEVKKEIKAVELINAEEDALLRVDISANSADGSLDNIVNNL